MMRARDLSLTDAEIEALPAEEVLRWAYEEFGDRLCLSCSWQKQSSVLVHMVAGARARTSTSSSSTRTSSSGRPTRRASGSSSATGSR